MTRITRTVAAAMTMLSVAALTTSLAQAQVSEPATFQAQHPDRDVLNGGRLTPAAQAGAGAFAAYPSPYPAQGAPAARARRAHSRK